MVLLIDNYDSFTWNLVQCVGSINPSLEIRVVRNDEITAAEAEALAPSHVIVSPGPCSPREAGASNDIIRRMAGRAPILGVCLGHQCIGQVHGMSVVRHARIMHGKTSEIRHDGIGIFEGVPDPFTATRYHSLVVLRESVPERDWEVSAWTTDTFDDGSRHEVVMGLRRRDAAGGSPIDGVQFHPESFLTAEGPRLIRNFLGV